MRKGKRESPERPETPLLNKIATPEEIRKLEEEAEEKDDILEDWHATRVSLGAI